MLKYFSWNQVISLLFLPLIFLSACKKDDDGNFDVNADVQLKSFRLANFDGTIDQRTGIISVSVPFGTDITVMQAAVELPPGANSVPAPDATLNFTGDVAYRITNGNLYKNYTVKVMIVPPVQSFSIDNVQGTIDHESKSITVLLPDGTDLTTLVPQLTLEDGVIATPSTGSTVDFTNTVTYTFTLGSASVKYQVTAISNSINEYAFLGLSASRAAISDPDEKAAADWFFLNYPAADYVSFQSIETGRNLTNYKVIWWHLDETQELPAEALTPAVTGTLKEYRANGGNLLLSTFATRYVEALEIVPEGRGPNNVFGDFGTGGFIDQNSNWGISFRSREDHPVFAGLETYEPGKMWLLEKGTFRQNHTAWWFLPEWGGYGNAATWREQTGGINLASEAWDDHLDGRVGIAEWKTDEDANVIIIAFGAYDWYTEPLNGGSASNAFIKNIRTLTKNAIDYLRNN